jgi:hypothetical protein
VPSCRIVLWFKLRDQFKVSKLQAFTTCTKLLNVLLIRNSEVRMVLHCKTWRFFTVYNDFKIEVWSRKPQPGGRGQCPPPWKKKLGNIWIELSKKNYPFPCGRVLAVVFAQCTTAAKTANHYTDRLWRYVTKPGPGPPRLSIGIWMLPWKLNYDERKAFGRQLQYFVVWINITEQILNKADVGYEMQIIAFLIQCLFCERIGFTGKTNPQF